MLFAGDVGTNLMGLGDPVDLAAVHLVVSDQALFLQPRQPGVDRAG